MLEIIYNDSYSQLTLMNNLNKECFVVVDDDLKQYITIVYNPFEPSKKDLIEQWELSLMDYFNLSEDDKFLKDWRTNMFNNSLIAFKEWLNTQKGVLFNEN